MIVRRLGAGDEAVAREAVALFKRSYPSVDYMARFLGNKDNYFYVAEAGGVSVGFLLAYRIERCDGERAMMLLYEVEVLSQHRRQGTGRALVEAVKRECKQGEFLRMFVIAEEPNEPAKNLYLATGGKQEGGAVLFHYWVESSG